MLRKGVKLLIKKMVDYKTVIFDKDDFNELKTNIEKYGKSE